MNLFQKMIESLVPPIATGTSEEVQRKVRLAVKYSIIVQIAVGLYLVVDTFFLERFPPWRYYSILMLALNWAVLFSGRLWRKPRLIQILAPATFLGLVAFGALDNGGIFGPIPSSFALTTMITIALSGQRTSTIYLVICLTLTTLFAIFSYSPHIAPVSLSPYTYALANFVMVITTYWFFSLYEREQIRLRSIEQEHHRLQTLTQAFSTLNHEINTPLNSVFLALEMVKQKNHHKKEDEETLFKNAFDGLNQIKNVLTYISSIRPEDLLEDTYHSSTPNVPSSKVYLLAYDEKPKGYKDKGEQVS